MRRKEEEEANERPPFRYHMRPTMDGRRHAVHLQLAIFVVYRPANPGKKSIHFDKHFTLSPYPEHVADPKIEKNPYFDTQKPPEGQPPWVPNDHDSTKPMKSVLIGTLSQYQQAKTTALKK